MGSQNIKGLKVEIDGETTGLEAAQKRIGKNANDLNKELAQVNKGLKFDPSNTVLLAQKQEILKEKIANTRQGLDALKQAQDRVEQMYAAGEIDKGQYRAFQREVATAESKLQTFEAQVKDVDQAQEKAHRSTGEWGDKLKTGLKAGLLAAGAAIAAVTAAIGAMAAKVINNADELKKLSDQTGLSAERLQELQYIGDDVGVSLDTIASSQAKLTKAMNAARKGTGAQADAFEALGISVVDVDGNLRDAKDVMMEAFDALNSVGNETERDALAMAIFGRGAQELNPLIKAGSKSLKEMAEEARKTGAVMSNEAVDALDAFGDAWDHTKQSILGVIGEALAPLMPQLTELMSSLKDRLAPAMQWVAETVIPALMNMLSGEDGAGGLGGALSVLMGVMGIVKEFFLAAWPAIQQVVKVFADFLMGPEGQALITGALDLVLAAANAVYEIFTAVWPTIRDTVLPLITDLIDALAPLIADLMEDLAPILDTIFEIFTVTWKAIAPLLKPILYVIAEALNIILWPLREIKELIDWLAGREGGWTYSGPSGPQSDAGVYLDPDNYTQKAKGGIVNRPVIAGEAGPEAILPLNDPKRFWEVLGQALGRPGILGSASSGAATSGDTTTYQIGRVTIDGSKMPTPDFQGLIASIQTAVRMGGASA